jgi:hypothetical protein
MDEKLSDRSKDMADSDENKKLLAELSMSADDQIVWLGVIVGALILAGSFIWGAVQLLF